MLGKREWEPGPWGMTEGPGRSGWAWPRGVPGEFCIMLYLARRKDRAEDRAEDRAGQGNPAGLFQAQNDTQHLWRLFKLLATFWHCYLQAET